MATNIFTIQSKALPDDAQVVGFRGREGISEPYRFDIGIVHRDGGFDQDAAILSPATLQINLGDEQPPHVYHGILAAVELLHTYEDRYLYRAVLVPKLWQLTLTRHSNVWTATSIPKVIKDVLEWSGLTSDEFALQLDESYADREFVAQYKESNLAFISRWMERLGIFYYFEQGDDKEKLVIVDKKSFDDGQDMPHVRYVPTGHGDHMALEAFRSFRCKSNALPAKVELWDYDYLNPRLDVRGASDASPNGIGEIARFGDDFFLTPTEGNKLAKIRAEQIIAQRKVFHGNGRAFGLRSGQPFTLEEHPRADFSNKIYLVTSIDHYGNQAGADAFFKEMLELDSEDEYSCDVRAIRGDVQYRTPERQIWPRIEGYESGTVCGEADSQYAQIDDHGRYKIRVMFDESDLGDGKASAWVRMQQPYGGSNEGFHFPLVKGTEVLLWFMGGDPDRPVIAGVAPNAQTPSPVINHNHTTNIIQTINLNLIEIEDIENGQYFYFYCPVANTFLHMGVLRNDYNIILNTEGHVHFEFGGQQVIDIALTLTENVELDVTFNYAQNWICNVAVDNNITIDANLHLKVGADVTWSIGANWFAEITCDNILEIGGNQKVRINVDQDVMITSNQIVNIGGDQNITIGGDQNVTITGKQNIDVQSDWKWNVLGHEIQAKMANSTEITIGLKNEAFIGVKNSLFVGGQTNITVADLTELKLASMLSLTIAEMTELTLADKLALTAGTIIEIGGGIKVGVFAGLGVEIFGGIKIQATAGPTFALSGGPFTVADPIKIEI